MAAPTPVSALVHSSTLVTAGVYLIMRFGFCYGRSLTGLQSLVEITLVLSGIRAGRSYDVKHIIAISTLRNLCLMFLRLMAGYARVTLFHLVSHALFKALTFLCAGNIILASGHSQDIRMMGRVGQKVPVSILCFFFSVLSLSGFFFTSGFFSKDMVLEVLTQESALSFGIFGGGILRYYAGSYAGEMFDELTSEEAEVVCHNRVEIKPSFLGPLVRLRIVSLVRGWYLRKALVPHPRAFFVGGVDFLFLLGLISADDREEDDKSGENSMAFLVDGLPELKTIFWGEVLNYCREIEHGALEWLPDYLRYRRRMESVRRVGKGWFE